MIPWRSSATGSAETPITGLEHPQAAVYIPDVDRIAVSSQSGKLRFYDAASYVLVQTLDFGNEANTDNMRYDPRSKRLYVGYGAGSRGAIAVVDPAAMERMEEYQVGTHPESFQLETTGPRIFVNLPGQGSIGVIDRTTGAVMKWKIPAGGHPIRRRRRHLALCTWRGRPLV